MRVLDLIPNPQALLTRRYWRDRANIINGLATEYPIRAEAPTNNRSVNQRPISGNSQNGNVPTGTTNTTRSEMESSGNYEVPGNSTEASGSLNGTERAGRRK